MAWTDPGLSVREPFTEERKTLRVEIECCAV